MTKSLQEKLYQEVKDKTIFNQAQEYAQLYLETIFDRNVYPEKEALDNLNVFDEELPLETADSKEVLAKLNTYGSPATTATLGGRYFGFVTGSTVPIGLAAKTLATYWDQAPVMNVLSPIANKLESVVEKWMVDLFSLPKETCAGFVSGTTTANLCGLAAARYHILNKLAWDINTKGLNGAPKIRIITGNQAHSSAIKALAILGFGTENIERVDVDNQGRIITSKLPELDENCIVILQAGNVTSGSFDDFDTICTKAEKAGAWVHVDGAFGLWAASVNKLKYLTKGIERADSWAVDGHKTLNTPYDCGMVLCKHAISLTSALSMSGSYIKKSNDRDGMFYTPEMSRRARVIEMWAIMRYLGKQGIDEMILTMHLRAKQFADEIQKIDGFYVDNDVVFNQVVVRCKDDYTTETVMNKSQELREFWAGGAVWFGKKVIRISVCSWATTTNDITRAVKSMKKALELVS